MDHLMTCQKLVFNETFQKAGLMFLISTGVMFLIYIRYGMPFNPFRGTRHVQYPLGLQPV